jgi:hypothetical protein
MMQRRWWPCPYETPPFWVFFMCASLFIIQLRPAIIKSKSLE